MNNLKKFGALAFVSALVLTGCGKKDTVTCTAETTEAGEKLKTEIVGTLKDGKISSVKAKMTFEKEDSAKTYCGLLGLVSASEDGAKVDVKCDKKTITISNYDKLDSDSKVIGLTKDEFINEMKSSASAEVTCK